MVPVMLGCGNRPRSDDLTEGDSAAVKAVAPELPELLGAFRKPKTAADEMPGDEQETLAQLGPNARPGESPQLSRRLELANGEYAYVWPQADGFCKAWDTSTGCASTRLLADRGVLVAFSARRDSPTDETFDVSVFALARDGIDEVQLVLTDGRTLTRKIQENGALIRLTELPAGAHWRNPDGSSGSQAVMPPGGEAAWDPVAASDR
jgi:hypothetical protein